MSGEAQAQRELLIVRKSTSLKLVPIEFAFIANFKQSLRFEVYYTNFMLFSSSSSAAKSASKASSKSGSKGTANIPLIAGELNTDYGPNDGLPDVIYVIPMRVLGALLLGFGIVELVIGIEINGIVTNVMLGSWWCAPAVFICSFLALASNTKMIVMAGAVFALIAMTFALTASSVDGSAAHRFYNYEACYSPASGKVYGNQDYAPFLLDTCTAGASASAHLCYCASDEDELCWEYDLSSTKYNCNVLLTEYPRLLTLSFAICLVMLVLATAYLSLTIVSIFCLKRCMKRKPAGDELQQPVR